MIFSKLTGHPLFRQAALIAGAFALAACATADVDNTTGSRLEQPATGAPPQAAIEAGDIAIAGQDFSHDIRDLPPIANASAPSLVRFTGVTSIVRNDDGQRVDIDTEPYTALLRDRLLLGDREKLRFVERQLPPLTTTTGHGKHQGALSSEAEDADYQVLAELRGKVNADLYRIQLEFIDIHSGNVLLNELYLIRKEAGGSSGGDLSDENSGQMPEAPEAPQATAAASASPVDRDSDVPAGTSQYQPPQPPMRDDGN
jgi:hypothetical protein